LKETTNLIEKHHHEVPSRKYELNIAYAGILAAGLDGIKMKLEPPQPVEEDIYKMSQQERTKRGIAVLPGTLGKAWRNFPRTDAYKKLWDASSARSSLSLKQREWREFNVMVHEWERKKYLDV
jgi:glutamine synthetase